MRRELGPVAIRVDDRVLQARAELLRLVLSIARHGHPPGQALSRDDTPMCRVEECRRGLIAGLFAG
jgi:hypothetical protein